MDDLDLSRGDLQSFSVLVDRARRAGMSVSEFCVVAGITDVTYYRLLKAPHKHELRLREARAGLDRWIDKNVGG